MPKTHLITTTTKPEGTRWFYQDDPLKTKMVTGWIRSYPGLKFFWGREINPTTWEKIYEFVDRDTCDKFIIDLANQDAEIVREEYRKANGQTITIEIVEMP
jgi:hypothetical protein